jgi:putative heme-binding domain-containing protein
VASLLRAISDAHATNQMDQVRLRLNDRNPEIAAAAERTLKELGQGNVLASSSKRKSIIAKMSYEDVLQQVAKMPGDSKIGAGLFEKVGCIKCHTTLKSEPLKGPFLGDITARYSRPEIIESILRPNAHIAQGFETTTLETKDGTEYEGFVVHESGDNIEIRNIVGATVVARKDIAKRGTRPTSIMPEGLADPLTVDELASLLAYLQSFKSP